MTSPFPNVPSWPSGHEVLGTETLQVTNLLAGISSDGGLWPKQNFLKGGTGTSRTSSSLVLDPDLQQTLVANGVYKVIIRGLFACATAAVGIQTMWQVPAGTSGNRSALGPSSTSTNTSADILTMHSGIHAFATAVAYGSRASATSESYFEETSILTMGSTGGVVGLQWGQISSSGNATLLGPGSSMEVERWA
jgi:hypothetical protein